MGQFWYLSLEIDSGTAGLVKVGGLGVSTGFGAVGAGAGVGVLTGVGVGVGLVAGGVPPTLGAPRVDGAPLDDAAWAWY